MLTHTTQYVLNPEVKSEKLEKAIFFIKGIGSVKKVAYLPKKSSRTLLLEKRTLLTRI